MSRSLYDEDGVDGPWLKAMEERTAMHTSGGRLRFIMDDGTTRDGYLQGAGGIVRSVESARRHVRMARAGKPLRIATPDGLPTHGFLYSTQDWRETGRAALLDLAQVADVEAA